MTENKNKNKKTSMPANVVAAAAVSVRTPSWTGAPRPRAVYWQPARHAVAESQVNACHLSLQVNAPHHSSHISRHQSDSFLQASAAAAASAQHT